MAEIRNFTKREALCFFAIIVVIIMILYGVTLHEPSVPSYNAHFYDEHSDGKIFSYSSHPKDTKKDIIPLPIPFDGSAGIVAKNSDQRSNTLKMKEKFQEKMMYLYMHMA